MSGPTEARISQIPNEAPDDSMSETDKLQLSLSAYLTNFTQASLAMTVAYGVVSANKDQLKDHLNEPISGIVNDPKVFLRTLDDDERTKAMEVLEQSTKQSVDEIVLTILNMHAVLLCSTFEIILDDFLLELTTLSTKALLAVAADKSKTLKQVLDAGNYESLLTEFRKQEVASFSREEIAKKFGQFGKMGIDQAEVFNWKIYSKEIQHLLAGNDANTLSQIFNKRHSIVHGGKRPFTEEQEVVKIQTFFEKTIMNLCFVTAKKYDLSVDIFSPKYAEAQKPKVPPNA